MGLIRKSLAVSSLGLVRDSSKKQRVAKAQLNELRKQTKLSCASRPSSWRLRLLLCLRHLWSRR